MRHIDLIVIHCSATRCDQNFSVTALIRWHEEKFGFTGYHYYITHAKGYNRHSLGICYEGGLDEQGKSADTRTPMQKQALLTLLRRLKKEHPDAEILGHRDLPNVHKDCPCFDARSEYQCLKLFNEEGKE